MQKNILITGGTGLVGKAVTQFLLQKNYSVTILSRNPALAKANNSFGSQVNFAALDLHKKTIDADAIKKADFIIHLAGAPVMDKKWTNAYKKEIVDSRIESGKLIADYLAKIPNKVQAVIGASAIGFYGQDTAETLMHPFTENAPADTHFLGTTCKLWEDSLAPIQALGIRHVCLRIGIVLGKGGGALEEFIKPLKLSLASILGNGKQMVSWIHLQDLCEIFLYTIENKKINGAYNAVAPAPVSNKKLTLTLAKIMRGNNLFLYQCQHLF